jgi:NADH-quinone oxidoreductase subunit J
VSAQNVFFYLLAAMMVFSAIRVVTTKNVVHAALYLVAVLTGVAAQYLLLASEYVANAQVLVYVGAIVVLVLFGVMLTRAKIGEDLDLTNPYWLLGLFTSIGVLGVTSYAVTDQWGDEKLDTVAATTLIGTNTEQVSDAIFSTYLVPFEAISVLLLAALIGAIVLARKD